MPLPGETGPSGPADDVPDFRVDHHEHPGQLSEDAIDAVLQLAHPEVTACYENVLTTSPGLRGTANTVFIIGTDGAVIGAASSGIEPRLARCIDDVVSRRHFPPPRGGTVKVRYPFTFQSTAASSASDSSAPTSSDRYGTRGPTQTSSRVTCGRRR